MVTVVGIDPDKDVHIAVAVDAAGTPICKPLTVKNDAALIATLLKWIRSAGCACDGEAACATRGGDEAGLHRGTHAEFAVQG
ncbi:hypothetical protein ACQP1G_17130 [Nocardia sp. CA-107356]|uniref:hypothetical protein n=1 Tax=Nocardia sp. CA-107356 TaxID=3239972 RepID=UPI003D8F4A89